MVFRGGLVLLLALLVALWASASTAVVASQASPGSVLNVSISFDNDGRVMYSVARNDRPVIEPSRVKLQEKGTLERRLDVVFRIYDDGLGFRYEFPEQPSLQTISVGDELTEFTVADPATAWWIPAGEWNRYEYLYDKTDLGEVSQAHTPITVRTRDGLHIAFHEAALVDYSGMWLRRVSGQRLRTTLAPSSSGAKVVRKAPFTTPWRTLQIADSAGGLVMSDLIVAAAKR